MRHQKPETWNVQEAATSIPGARETFAASKISATTRQNLAHAMAATSTSLDETMAKIAMRMRRNAARVQPTRETAGAVPTTADAEVVA